jgi:hypothetical protein
MGPDERIGFYVPKGHQLAHMLAFFWMFAPADAARLNNFEFEHIKHVKDAPKQARGHEGTMLEELKAVVDRINAVKTQLTQECGLHLQDNFVPDLSTSYSISVFNSATVLSAFFHTTDTTVQNSDTCNAPGVSVCMPTHHARWRATCGVRWTALHIL